MKLLSDIYATITGSKCFICKKEHLSICDDCLKNLPQIDFPFCMGCDLLSIDGKTHLYCQQGCYIKNHISSYTYERDVKKLLLIYKKNRSLFNEIQTLIDYAMKDLTNSILDVDYIVPFPKTPKIIENGEKSLPELIVNKIHKRYKIRVIDILAKNSIIKQKERQSINRSAIKNDIFITPNKLITPQGKTFLVVDDITTTGSSLRSAADLLMQSGAKYINSYTLVKDLRYN
ncbi:MAG: competence protein ComFC [Patescibacteria group bacterium]|nr:competence protein ComFC [Patescibacteria group bacterium]